MLNNVINNSTCRLCGSSHYKLLYNIHSPFDNSKENIPGLPRAIRLKVVKCGHCGLVYALNGLDKNFIAHCYENNKDTLYTMEERANRLSARIILGKIRRFKEKGDLLDIGCSAGFLVDEAVKLGYKAEGIDLSEYAANFAKERLRLTVCRGDILAKDFPENHFDVITVTDVIEHLSEPLECLVKIKKILKPGGILYITTPDIESWLSRIFKSRWKGIRNSHLFYFSGKTMRNMLKQAGLDAIRSGKYARTHSIGYWFGRAALYNRFACSPVTKINAGSGIPLTVNFFDHLEFFAKKKD